MANLQQYRAKRNFRITGEPPGRQHRKDTEPGLAFVIHKHDATRLHYDLRLEHDGVLWSWAVTRGPSLDPSEKRLAVHVEDHPLDYATFEGVIPAKQYGAGPVIVWDRGTWEPEGDPAAGLKKGHLRFELQGEKLQGSWHLVRLRPRGGEKRDNWLLIKSKDEFATTNGDILEDEPRSVKSGLTIDEVAKGERENGKAKSKATGTAAKAKSRGRSLPDFVPPCLARLQSTPPVGDHWLHEVKFDGYRMQARIEGGKVTLKTRTGLDWTDRFGTAIPSALAELDCDAALIDGEIVVPDEKGGSSFSALQLDLSERRTSRMVCYVFDLLHLDGEDMTGEPLLHRKEKLRDLLAGEELGPVRYSEHFDEHGKVVLEHACRMGLEGVVSKRADASYRSGRGFDWIKSKCTLRQEFVVTGYVPSDKSGRELRSLVVGYHDGGRLKPAGHVGTGFSQRNAKGLKTKLDALRTDKSAYEGAAARERRVIWVKPELVAEIEFRSWTRGGNIRHASFQGLREDKPASEVVMEKADSGNKTGDTSPRPTGKAGARPRAATTVELSNPDKKLWPDEGVSKRDLLAYYASVWPRMERYVVNRPLALVRAPDGVGKQRFFQKHASAGMHDAVGRMKDPEDGEELLFIRDFDGLAGLVQLGVVEIHIWGATIDQIETPDQIVFDLDPDEGLDVEDVRRAALEVKEKLGDLGLPNFVKTSGGKGFHAMVPLKPKADWAAVKGFAHDFALAMAEAAPDRYTATLSKKARKGRIFIDYLRNGRGSTTVAPYSSRAKTGATVSMPVTWKMVADGTGPADFTLDGAETSARLKAADPWKDFFERGKALERR